jgi:integrase
MHYFEDHELIALLKVAYEKNRLHHLALLVSLIHGLRVNELLALTMNDVQGDYIVIRGLKKGKTSLEPLHHSDNPLFDESQLAVHAHGLRQSGQERLFPFCRQWCDRFIRKYATEAGVAIAKAHHHSLRHTVAMLIWSQSHSLSQITACLRHRSGASSIVYLHEVDRQKSVQSLNAALNALENRRLKVQV